jgi:hypothetical protein
MVVRKLRVMAAMVGVAAAATCALSVVMGSTLASASTRLRSGSLHAQLVSHVTPVGNTAPSGVIAGSNVIAAIVGTLAILALAFLVVTFIRRRVTIA